MVIRLLILLSYLHILSQDGKCQIITSLGTPAVQQYKKNIYKAGNQNWSIAIAQNGLLYAANTEGLVSYDGTYWDLHRLPNKSTIRCVEIAKDNKIYTGGNEEFGYWERNQIGKLKYTSLSNLLEDKSLLKNDEIWKIIFTDESIIFHAFSKSYVYKNGSFQIITAKGEPFLFAHQVNSKVFYEQIPSGLHELHNGKLVAIKNKNILKDKNILSMLHFQAGSILIGTAHHGLYLMDDDYNIVKWDCEASAILSQNQINNGIALPNNYYAFGTIKNGVYIINNTGQIVQHINKNNGLQNNTVLSLEIDLQYNLWVGLDNGLDCIQLNSPLYYYADLRGEIGTVYTSAIFDNQLYLGTNQGLYVCNWQEAKFNNSFDFKLVQKSNSHVWDLSIINNQLLCGNNDGTFIIKGAQMYKISAFTGGYFYLQSNQGNYAIQGNYTGLSLFDTHKKITFQKQFEQIKEPIRFAKEHNINQFWVGNPSNLHLIQYDPEKKDIAIKYSTSKDSSLTNINFYDVNHLESRLVFSSDTGLFIYDEVLKKFVYYDELNNKLNSFKTTGKIIRKKYNQYFLASESSLSIATFNDDGTIRIDSTTLHPLQNKMMKNHENILNIGNDQYLIGLDHGFAIYSEFQQIKQSTPPKPQIAAITSQNKHDIKYIDDIIKIPYVDNNFRIAFSSPNFHNQVRYQYILDGYNDDWSIIEDQPFKDFVNLPFGTYTFKVRAISIDGAVSAPTAITIEIITPWYYTIWMIILYILILIGIIYYAIQKYRERIAHKQWILNKKMLEKQRIEIAKHAEEKEREIIKLKNLQLEKELEIKNRELSNATTSILYKNEMLNNLNSELNKLKDAQGQKIDNGQINRLNKLIENIQNDNRDWDIFEKSFNDAHENFFKKLKSDFPELVPNDLKLCAYLRLNMSSKEIASLLNITTRGVEIRRYRLRKKLGLTNDKNLSEFLLER